MITKFELTNNDNIYVFPVSCIENPLIVSKNYGAKSKRSYLSCMPRSEWPGLWIRRIKAHMGDTNDDTDED